MITVYPSGSPSVWVCLAVRDGVTVVRAFTDEPTLEQAERMKIGAEDFELIQVRLDSTTEEELT